MAAYSLRASHRAGSTGMAALVLPTLRAARVRDVRSAPATGPGADVVMDDGDIWHCPILPVPVTCPTCRPSVRGAS